MGNLLSDNGVNETDINVIQQITQEAIYPTNDPIWQKVFTMKGYLQNLSRSYLSSITASWSENMRSDLAIP